MAKFHLIRQSDAERKTATLTQKSIQILSCCAVEKRLQLTSSICLIQAKK